MLDELYEQSKKLLGDYDKPELIIKLGILKKGTIYDWVNNQIKIDLRDLSNSDDLKRIISHELIHAWYSQKGILRNILALFSKSRRDYVEALAYVLIDMICSVKRNKSK